MFTIEFAIRSISGTHRDPDGDHRDPDGIKHTKLFGFHVNCYFLPRCNSIDMLNTRRSKSTMPTLAEFADKIYFDKCQQIRKVTSDSAEF